MCIYNVLDMRALILLFCACAISALVHGCLDPNAELVDYPNPCPATCDQLSGPPGGCDQTSMPQGCACIFGYVLNAEGKCIESTNCPPKQCPKNEEWNTCPEYCNPDEYCDRYVNGWIRGCTVPQPDQMFCKPACLCKAGFVRIGKDCVFPTKCCKQPGTRLVDCPAPCDKTCDRVPTPDCVDDCPVRKCICAQGFVRSGEDCIPECKCPARGL